MSNDQIIEKTIAFVKEQLVGAEGGHDWWHIYRVWKLSGHIAKEEGCDSLVIDLGALLHDIADAKFHDGDEEIGPQLARKFLVSLKVDRTTIGHIENIIRNISFKNSGEQGFSSLELDIIQDADRLDALGAIGIARAFNYGGFKNRPLYDPDIKPKPAMSKKEYKKSLSPTINHFYEKLLLLKDMMNTSTGKAMAEERHKYMEDYLKRFYIEWEGIK
jgi:uncharacterized protein